MGTSITEGTVIEWRKSVGDDVAVDETICEISTDKVDTECPSPASGTIAEILVGTGETVEVGTVIARIMTSDMSGGHAGLAAPANPSDRAEAVARQPTRAAGASSAERNTERAALGFSPVVARMLEHHRLDPASITGTGRNGRITKKDVVAAVDGSKTSADELPLHSDSPYRAEAANPADHRHGSARQSVSTAAVDDLGGTTDQLSRMRQTIGARMRASQSTAATCHTMVECDVTSIETRRRELGLTALPIVASATVETLREFPELNATLDGATITRYSASIWELRSHLVRTD